MSDAPAPDEAATRPAGAVPPRSGCHCDGAPTSSASNAADRSARWTTTLNGPRLRQLRQEHGLSQEALADRAGLSLTTVARLEQRPTAPCRCRTLARLAAALDEQPAAFGLSPETGTATYTRP